MGPLNIAQRQARDVLTSLPDGSGIYLYLPKAKGHLAQTHAQTFSDKSHGVLYLFIH